MTLAEWWKDQAERQDAAARAFVSTDDNYSRSAELRQSEVRDGELAKDAGLR